MVRKLLTAIWSTLTDSLLRSKNTVLLCFRIPRRPLDNTYRWYLRQWPVWTSVSDHTKSATTKRTKVLYRDAAGIGAWLDLREEQIAARIKLGTIGIELGLWGSGWVWLIIAASSYGVAFAAISIGLFLVNALLVAPAAAHTANPWRRLGQLAVGWAAISVGLLAGAGWPPLTSWSQQPPHVLQILAFAAGSIALFSLLGALLARITFFILDLTTVRRRVRQFSQITALLQTVELIDWLRTDDRIGEAWRRRWAIRKLELISQCVEKGLPGLLVMPAHKAGDAARHRFHQAATVIRSYETWIAVPQPETASKLRSCLAELAMTFLNTHYDLLPTSAVGLTSDSPPSGREVKRIVIGLLAATAPLGIVISWPLLGLAIPDYLRQWLTGFAIAWLIAKVLQLLDPAHSKTWEQVHATLGSPRPPTDRS